MIEHLGSFESKSLGWGSFRTGRPQTGTIPPKLFPPPIRICPKSHHPQTADRFRRKPMTVAAGFVYDEGLLFCVDTKISTDIKTNESKILYQTYGDGKCATAFAISGYDLKFAKAAIESCEGAILSVNFIDTAINIESIRKTIQSALAKFYKQHIFPHPDRGAGGAVDFEFLIGIWLGGETRMFRSRETMLVTVDGYDCLGTGAHLAVYLIRQYRRASHNANTLQDVGLIASFAVNSAINYVETVGGEAEMLVMKNRGAIDSGCKVEIYPGGEFIPRLQALTWGLIHELAQVRGDFEIETANRFEQYFDRVRSLNNSQKFLFDALRIGQDNDPHFWD